MISYNGVGVGGSTFSLPSNTFALFFCFEGGPSNKSKRPFGSVSRIGGVRCQ